MTMTRDEEIVTFHYILGVAIANWTKVENNIAKIMAACFKSEELNREALGVGFFSLEGFGARLKFADSVISRKIAGNPILHEDWKALADRARTIVKGRNKLAHWAIGKYWHRASGLRVVLVPWVYEKSRKKSKQPLPPRGSLNIREMYRLSMSFLAFAAALDNFRHRAIGKQERHAKSDEQAGNPPTADSLGREIREVFSNRP